MHSFYATSEATYLFAKRFSHYKDFYTKHDGLIFSKLGFGTFKKEPYKEENYTFSYKEALQAAIDLGINLIDTALNYRYQQSEKEIAQALKELFQAGKLKREELIICSKGGFIPLEFPFPQNPYEWIDEHIIAKGLAHPEEIELDQHCMTPSFLRYSCEQSLANLELDCLDIYFLHNPETQLTKLGQEAFYKQIEAVFELFETLVREKKIKAYGLAVWNAFSYTQDNDEHISIEKVYDIACKVAGAGHHFKYLQLPFNMAKTHAYSMPTQKMSDGNFYTPLQVAHKLGLGVIGSATLLQMHLFQKPFRAEVGYLLDKSMHLKSDIQLALQFARSTRGFISNLFSSTQANHVAHNTQIAEISAVSKEHYNLLYRMER